ncbi:DUF769 domain-containing protein [Xylella fastidiosa subsp. multiplex]|uniref:DUF769 domain-containing protein n=5 Tax=Xylella fastidiosa TaxID=2371 RepID=UPI00146473F1|nr:DUF769 domain-containing protein [Xylella fastidiosa]QJP48541.1 DUF769 domain-containing protein [Xylella fastidiosa subsp. multiplex]
MSLHPRLSCSLLAGCSSGPPIDSRTGKPMMAGPWENRDLSLEYFQLDFLGQYTVKHAFINGINIDRCYPGVPPDHVQVVMMSFRDGSRSPGIIVMGRGHPPRPRSETAAFIGYEKSNTHDEQLPVGDSVFQELDNKIDRMQTALMVGGDEQAVQYGRDLGSLVWDIGSVAIGVGGVAKAGGVLAEAGIKVSEDVLERMAARNLVKLVEESKKTYVDIKGVLGKRNLNPLVVEGIQLEAIPTRNKAGHVKLFASEMLTDQQIRNYAQKLAPGVPLKETRTKGVYVANLSDGTVVTLRSESSSKDMTKARWTIDINKNPSLREVTDQKVEIKFR